MSAHVAPMYCPYCGGERLVPHASNHGGWECSECMRVFSTKFLGLLSRANPPSEDAATSRQLKAEGPHSPQGHVQ